MITTMGNHSGMSLYLRSTKKLEPTEWTRALSTTSQSESSRWRRVAHGLQTERKRRTRNHEIRTAVNCKL